MSSEVIGAIGGVFQVARTLYEYYDTHKRNKNLLDVLEGFSANLEVAIERLNAREALLHGQPSPALESIGKDFENAKVWLIANDKNLRSFWTALQAADKLKDLDDRLTKAFASKMSVAIFSSLQDSRHATTRIQSTLDGLHGHMEGLVRDASRAGLQEAIRELKEEAWAFRGRGSEVESGFTNGEAEKIISNLVDQLSAQERLREDGEYIALHTSGYRPLVPTPAIKSSNIPRSSPDPFELTTVYTNGLDSSTNLNGTVGTYPSGDGRMLGRNGSSNSNNAGESTESSGEGKPRRRKKTLGPAIPPGSIVFAPKDPFTEEDLVDPVLASDGLIHDRWTMIDGKYDNVRDPSEPLIIVGDVVQLREAIFNSYPERRTIFESKRKAYREATITLYESKEHNNLPSVIDRLSHIILFEPTSVSLRIRRGIARYRLRELEGALADLEKAVELSTRDVNGNPGKHEPDIDALRARALVKDEIHDKDGAMKDIEAVLKTSPDDVLVLSLRACLRGSAGDLIGAQNDLARTNSAVTQGTAYRSRLGDADVDLEYLARGWAYSNIEDFPAATGDFNYSLHLRAEHEPYTLACRALAKVRSGLRTSVNSLVKEGFKELDQAIALVSTFSDAHVADIERSFHSSGEAVTTISKEDGLPVQAFATYFLRGMAYFAKQDFARSLSDFVRGMKHRPKIVKESADFRFALATLRAEGGDFAGATKDFDFAIALSIKPEEKFVYQTTRESYGL